MASRILLISTNRYTMPDAVFPLGLAYLNAALRRAGHDTRWVDYNADSQPLSVVLAEYRPHFVGISIRNIDDVLIRKRETYFGGLDAITETVRRVNPCPVILGGSGYSIFPERLLHLTGADYGIRGEGEESFSALISALAHGGDVTVIPGLVYRRGREIVANPRQPWRGTAGLDAADRPAHLVSYYLKHGGMLNLQTQRGCAHVCCYCTYPVIEGSTHRQRPPEIVAEEMAQLEVLGAKYVFIVDSIFNSSPQHVVETCEAILRRNLKIRWACFLRPQGLTPSLMDIMARAGLAHIEFGSDSLCDSVLEAYGKRFTFDDIRQSSELARQRHVDFCHYLICGGPGETTETLQTSFENSQRLTGAVIMAVVGMRVYPGTALCERALREGRMMADTDLLTPTYYIAPVLTVEEVFARLQQFSARSSNWIIGDPTPAYTRLAEQLRSRGVVGPLWSYFSMIQRLWPAAPAGANT
ncbi:MAG: lipid biosynthesis B12-binding/radical SAM protein [Verrucomicrobiota bacterium]|jgi:radical SAM superfamily enzyme YgiQ (UPF0313 family)